MRVYTPDYMYCIAFGKKLTNYAGYINSQPHILLKIKELHYVLTS